MTAGILAFNLAGASVMWVDMQRDADLRCDVKEGGLLAQNGDADWRLIAEPSAQSDLPTCRLVQRTESVVVG